MIPYKTQTPEDMTQKVHSHHKLTQTVYAQCPTARSTLTCLPEQHEEYLYSKSGVSLVA